MLANSFVGFNRFRCCNRTDILAWQCTIFGSTTKPCRLRVLLRALSSLVALRCIRRHCFSNKDLVWVASVGIEQMHFIQRLATMQHIILASKKTLFALGIFVASCGCCFNGDLGINTDAADNFSTSFLNAGQHKFKEGKFVDR